MIKSYGDEQASVVCPVSGTKGKAVKTVTLRSLIKEEQQHRITGGPYRFCDARDCEVVYFAEDGSHVFTKADMRVRVGVKETEAPRPICYCFNHTIEEIFDQIRRTGTYVKEALLRFGYDQEEACRPHGCDSEECCK